MVRIRRSQEGSYEDDELRPLLLDAPTVLGVESFQDAQIHIRVVARTLPGKQFDVARRLHEPRSSYSDGSSGSRAIGAIAWLIATAGLSTDLLRPPPRGRAPGWDAGLEVARRSGAYKRDVPRPRRLPLAARL